MHTILLSEGPYLSINGEGMLIGKPVIFIRTQGCAVGCSWCDSKYTWAKKTDTSKVYTYARLLDKLTDIGVQYPFWWTGGEPLEHWEEIKDFYKNKLSHTRDYDVLISAVPKYVSELSDYISHLVIDVKLSSAGIKYDQTDNIDKYLEDMSTELKMVVGPSDIDEAVASDKEISESGNYFTTFVLG